jgi:predicted N-acetyltransferase YhbS
MEMRLVRKEELIQAANLADSIFRVTGQTSMREAFPLIFAPESIHSFGAFDGERLVSFIGFVPFVLKVGNARLQVFSIGSVCTHDDYRGQGIAGKLLDLCKQHAAVSGASLIFISGGRSLYTRAQCFPFGQTKRFAIDSESAAQLTVRWNSAGEEHAIRLLEPTDVFGQHAVARSRGVAFEQSIADIARLTSAEAYTSCIKLTQQTLVALTADGDIEAFAVVAIPGRDVVGESEKPLALEWAGPAEAVAALLADAVARFRLPLLEAPIGWHEQQLAQLLQEANLASTAEPAAGTVYIVNAQRLLNQAAPYFAGAGVDTFGMKQQPSIQLMPTGTYRLALSQGSMDLTPNELVSLLFDPCSVHREAITGYVTLPLPNLNGLNFT